MQSTLCPISRWRWYPHLDSTPQAIQYQRSTTDLSIRLLYALSNTDVRDSPQPSVRDPVLRLQPHSCRVIRWPTRTAVVPSGPPLLLHREGCLQAERTRSKAESSSLLPECTAIVDEMTVPQSIQASSLATRFGELRACPQRRPFAESGQRRVECFT